jgi:hypothetical protein
METHHERMMTKMYSRLEETEANLQKMETTEEIESESEHQEVPKKEAAVKTIKAMEDRYGDQYHSDGGFQKSFPLLGSRLLTMQQLDTTNNRRALFSMWPGPRCYMEGTKSVLVEFCMGGREVRT